MPSPTCFITFVLISTRSSLLIPGFLGTPAVTTRGFKEKEIIEISNWISSIINNFDDDELLKNIKEKVHDLTHNFPVYNL